MTAPLQIAFLTGQSDPGQCALSPVQSAFLERIAQPGLTCVTTNFPYEPTDGYRDVPLVHASWNNLVLYIRAQSPEFARRHRPNVMRLIESAAHTLFLAGSCGLELFNQLYLPREYEQRCTLVCYGPVASHIPRFACAHCVQGGADWISRLGFPHPVRKIAGHHPDYLTRLEFLGLCQRIVSTLLRPCSNTSV